MLVFFAGSAGAGIVGIDLGGLSDSAALLLLLVQFLPLFLVENGFPLLKVIEPVSTGCYHVLIELFFVKSKVNDSILVHLLDRIGFLQGVVDPVQKSSHCHEVHIKFLGEFTYCTFDHLVGVLKNLSVNSLLFGKIVRPQSLKIAFVGFLIVSFISPLL